MTSASGNRARSIRPALVVARRRDKGVLAVDNVDHLVALVRNRQRRPRRHDECIGHGSSIRSPVGRLASRSLAYRGCNSCTFARHRPPPRPSPAFRRRDQPRRASPRSGRVAISHRHCERLLETRLRFCAERSAAAIAAATSCSFNERGARKPTYSQGASSVLVQAGRLAASQSCGSRRR